MTEQRRLDGPHAQQLCISGRDVVDARHDTRVNWIPPNADPSDLATLHEGIPPWMVRPFAAWFTSAMTYRVESSTRKRIEWVQEFDTRTRRESPLAGEFASYGPGHLLSRLGTNELLIHFLDFLVYKLARNGEEERNNRLEVIFADAGSAWRVGQRLGNAGLERRVPQGVVEAAESVMTTSGTAGSLLSEAWRSLYGHSPDYEDAYEKAIKAVEEAGVHIVCPNNAKATLGTMARDMENQEDWALPLGEDSKHPSRDAIYKMVQSLWAGQESRHGGNGYRKPTPEEAEAAVLLAVPLVQWFIAGTVARRP